VPAGVPADRACSDYDDTFTHIRNPKSELAAKAAKNAKKYKIIKKR
jgi:hypothetical protein